MLLPGLLLAATPLVGVEIDFPSVADVSIAAHPSERTFNLGGASRIRIKGTEHVGLFAFDMAAVAGRRVESGRLFLHAPVPHRLKTIGISTVAEPWIEGKSTGEAKPGEVCFAEAARGERPWSGGDFLAVTFGRGGSRWIAGDVREEGEGWLSIPVPPEFVEAMAAGDSHGIAVSDEKGQTRWNNDLSSRETRTHAPFLRVEIGEGPPRPRAPAAPPMPADTPPARSLPNVPASHVGRSPVELTAGRRLALLPAGAGIDPRRTIGSAATHPGWDDEGLRLRAARGEHVEIGLALDGPERDSFEVEIRWEEPNLLPFRAFVGWFVPAEPHPVVDPLIPLGDEGVRLPYAPNGIRRHRAAYLHLEWFVPPATPPGAREGALSIEIDGEITRIPVRIEVEPLAVPDRPSFVLSLNTYGFPGNGIEEERAWFRLAHEHRATLAPVPYSQSGRLTTGAAPPLRGEGERVEIASWEAWDARFGPLLDGSAFQGLPRDGVPLDHLFLPLHENWPTPIDGAYRYDGTVEDHGRLAPPIEESFPSAYRERFARIAEAFARHASEKGWAETRFLGFLNNKVDYRASGRGTSWWRLDEPAYRDDFLALRWFAERFREGVARGKGNAKMLFRVDLSRPEWRRDLLDGVVDLLVCNELAASGGIALETARRFGEEVWSYGEAPPPSADLDRCRRWVREAWLAGADGLVPWQSVGTAESWTRADPTALLYPGIPGLPPGPYPSIRLKALRRGALDVELAKR